jgi:hypothetical protein
VKNNRMTTLAIGLAAEAARRSQRQHTHAPERVFMETLHALLYGSANVTAERPAIEERPEDLVYPRAAA